MSSAVRAAAGERGGSKRSSGTATDRGRMTFKGKKKRKVKSRSKDKSEKRRSVVTGVLGLPIDWNEEDSEYYEDSQDETFEPSYPREFSRSNTR